jgi:hypothetical protein
MSNNRRGTSYRPKYKGSGALENNSEENLIDVQKKDGEQDLIEDVVSDFEYEEINEVEEESHKSNTDLDEEVVSELEEGVVLLEENLTEDVIVKEVDEKLEQDDEFYLLTKEEIELFNQDMQSSISEINVEKQSQEHKKVHVDLYDSTHCCYFLYNFNACCCRIY